MTKMKRTIAVLVAAAGLAITSGAAQAIPTLSIIWQSTGTATIFSPAASSTIVADIVLTTNTLTVDKVFISIEFDAGELQAVSARELSVVDLPSMGNQFSPLTKGTTIDNGLGLVEFFDQVNFSTGLVGGNTRTLGSVTFHVVGAANSSGDIDVIGSLQNVGVDTFGGPTGNLFGGNFVGASIVPEPTTALLVIASLAGLGYAGRRSLR